MTGAQIAKEGGRYVVTCAQHSWRWVATGGEAHATNLAAKHDREHDHTDPTAGPTTLDVAAAAAYVVIMDTAPGMSATARTAALHVWMLLTSLEHDAALAYAREVAATQTTAVLPPF